MVQLIDIAQSNIDSPIALQEKWNLSDEELAIALGKSSKTIRSYKVRTEANCYRKPPVTVNLFCVCLDKLWTADDKVTFFTTSRR